MAVSTRAFSGMVDQFVLHTHSRHSFWLGPAQPQAPGSAMTLGPTPSGIK